MAGGSYKANFGHHFLTIFRQAEKIAADNTHILHENFKMLPSDFVVQIKSFKSATKVFVHQKWTPMMNT